MIFHDATLRAIAQLNPSSLTALGAVSGIGPRKLESYGAAIIELLHGTSLPSRETAEE